MLQDEECKINKYNIDYQALNCAMKMKISHD